MDPSPDTVCGLSQTLFKILEECDEPFYSSGLQDRQLQELKSLVDALSKEVITLKSTTSDKPAPESSSLTPQQPSEQDTETTSSSANKESQPTPNTKTNKSNEGHQDHKFTVVIYGIDECDKGAPRHEQMNQHLHKVTTIITEAKTNINPLSI